jgi:hypothetical protein
MRKLLCLLLLLIGCNDMDKAGWSYQDVPAKVTQVRILQNGETIVRDDDHAVAGAVIGGVVTHSVPGAIVGAIIGSGEKATTHIEELRACHLYVETEDGQKAKFELGSSDSQINSCVLAEVGDKIIIQFGVLKGPSGKIYENYTSWKCDSFNCAHAVK